MSDQQTPQEIGTHALAKAVEHADRADRYVTRPFGSDKENHARIAMYGNLATAYAQIAKAAAALTTDNA
ncbi:hypothetical protein [Streptomyces sp. rh34]|uniref:hypothetical protein n=1 Tax=Streptomyces sp. rh34 TaxID=2034272 RepID=UPI000BF0E275|nr:hypothetical protein [Streptomyces sp. rh34]